MVHKTGLVEIILKVRKEWRFCRVHDDERCSGGLRSVTSDCWPWEVCQVWPFADIVLCPLNVCWWKNVLQSVSKLFTAPTIKEAILFYLYLLQECGIIPVLLLCCHSGNNIYTSFQHRCPNFKRRNVKVLWISRINYSLFFNRKLSY